MKVKFPQNVAHITIQSSLIYFLISCISLFIVTISHITINQKSYVKWCIWEIISAQNYKNMYIKVLA